MDSPLLTVEQAFSAMTFFLEHEYELGKSEDILILIGSLSRDVWADGGTADPACWCDWLDAVERVKRRAPPPTILT